MYGRWALILLGKLYILQYGLLLCHCSWSCWVSPRKSGWLPVVWVQYCFPLQVVRYSIGSLIPFARTIKSPLSFHFYGSSFIFNFIKFHTSNSSRHRHRHYQTGGLLFAAILTSFFVMHPDIHELPFKCNDSCHSAICREWADQNKD